MDATPKALLPVAITPPEPALRQRRRPKVAQPSEKRTRYHLPQALSTSSPVGYRQRISMSREEVEQMLPLLSMTRPTRFLEPESVKDQALFEESALGVLSARQSTNYRGHRQVTLGPKESHEIADILRRLKGLEAGVLDQASYTHIVLSRPYRTPFTLLLTFIGHRPLANLLTVPRRALNKRFKHTDDIPTIGYLQQLHLGVLADALERAVVVASEGRRGAQVFMSPFVGAAKKQNQEVIAELEAYCGLSKKDRFDGWRIAMVAQVGVLPEEDRIEAPSTTWRKFGANLLAFRSERILPGVNADSSAPEEYLKDQRMDVPDELTVMAGRAAYNAFAHWTGVGREVAKDLLMLERIDVLTPGGNERLRQIREMLSTVVHQIQKNLPLWADLPTGRAFSRNVERGKKAFALTGQRIYLGGISEAEIKRAGIDWDLGVRAVGACAARSSLYSELMGVMDLPEDCDLLAGLCLMAGPVNQNDIGKSFYGHDDMLEKTYPGRGVNTMLVWTLKAKTVADPIGNEEQLMNEAKKGALVDLRPGPHDIIKIYRDGGLEPFRQEGARVCYERAYADQNNFAKGAEGQDIPGNQGTPWPDRWRERPVF